MSKGSGNKSLLADGSFMTFGCLTFAVIGFIVILILALGNVGEILLMRYARDGYAAAYDAEFVRHLRVWVEFKQIIIFLGLCATVVLSVWGWSRRQPAQHIFYQPGNRPQQITVEAAEPAELEYEVPRFENMQPKPRKQLTDGGRR